MSFPWPKFARVSDAEPARPYSFKCPVDSQLKVCYGNIERRFNAHAGEEFHIEGANIKVKHGDELSKRAYVETERVNSVANLKMCFPVIEDIGDILVCPKIGLARMRIGRAYYYLHDLLHVTDVCIINSPYPIGVKYFGKDELRFFYPACKIFGYGVMLVDADGFQVTVYPSIDIPGGVISKVGRVTFKLKDLGTFGECISYRFENYATGQKVEVKNNSFFDAKSMSAFEFKDPPYDFERLKESILLTIYCCFGKFFSVDLRGGIESVKVMAH